VTTQEPTDEEDRIHILTEGDLAMLRWVMSIREEDCVDIDESAYDEDD
jgi:hypothetical protein